MTTARTMTMIMMIAMTIRTNKMKIKKQKRKSAKENLQASLVIKKIKKYSIIEKQRVASQFSKNTIIIRRRNKE